MIRFPSVLRDFRGFLPEAVSSLSDLTDETTLEDWAALTESKEQAMSCIRRHLNLEEGEQVSKPKTYRLATKRLLVALGHALAISTGRGLEGWVCRESGLRLLNEAARAKARVHLTDIPRGLGIVADQCGSGLSAVAFLQNHLGLSTLLLMDPPPSLLEVREAGLDSEGMGGRQSPA